MKKESPKDVELLKNVIEEKINDANSTKKIRKYIKGKLLGRGGFARCYEFTCQDNNKVFAAKVINKQNIQTQRQKLKLVSEIKIHKSLHHDQIVAFEHNFEDNENVYILLEVCQNQTLNELLKRRKKLSEIEVQCYIIQLIKGLQYLQNHKVIHRDLKLGNLFLTDKMQLKIGDFGLATKLDYEGEKKKTVCGTPNYIAPEVINGISHSYEVDVWAVGIIIYILIIGKPPFETNDIKLTYNKIKEVDYTFPEGEKISYPAMNLIRKILVRDPDKRPSYDEILMDDFFNQGAAIPKLMPLASLACPPTLDYIKKFIPNADENGICTLYKNEINENDKKKELNIKNNNDNNNKNEASTKDESNKEENKVEEKKEKLKGAELFVTKWVDYSSKYGLGYLMSNGFIGVFFNDCTKMIFNPRTNRLSFIDRKTSQEKDMVYCFDLKGAPKELQKKIFIFEQFKKYFEEEVRADKEKEEKEKEQNEETKLKMCKTAKKKVRDKKRNIQPKEEAVPEEEAIYVRKWMKTKQAIIFRLSNKTIQFWFKDNSELIILNEIVSYKNKKGEINVLKIDDALNSCNYEINKRIKYMQNIFTKMINENLNKNK